MKPGFHQHHLAPAKNSLVMACLTLLLSVVTLSCQQQGPARTTISLNGQWMFYVDSMADGNAVNPAGTGLKKLSGRIVTVPHAWNTERNLENYWGKCWYERTFNVTKEQLRKIVRIQFDAVYHDAVVYVNGMKAGEHKGSGYTRFFVDITPFLKTGENRLTVCADNSPSRASIPFLKSFDWANDGGIIRGVYEIVTNKTAIRNVHVAGIPNGNKGRAEISVTFLDTAKSLLSKISLEAEIFEENQKTQSRIFSGSLEGSMDKGIFHCTLNLGQVRLWHFDAPNLYKLQVRLFENGSEKDVFSTVFGFRSISVSNNRYVLNGEPVRLMGVEWMPGSSLEHGMAETHSDLAKNLELMKEANCIFTRFHWQQDEFVLDWCDRHGILVQEEVPYWGGITELNDTLLETGIRQVDEMMDAHFNHPSLIAWGIGNELKSHDAGNIRALKIIYRHVKEADTSRLVNYVSNQLATSFPSDGTSLPDASAGFDMMMFNEYFSTWYGKSIDVVPEELDRINSEYPGKAITISEWGLCEPVFKGGDARRAREMARQISIYGSKTYVAGAIYFCLNDYRTHMGEDRTYSYPQRVHGVCDINLHKKPSYEILKSISSPVIIKDISRKAEGIVLVLEGKTGIPSYTLRDYRIVAGNREINTGILRPGEERRFNLPVDAGEIAIYRPTGFEVLHTKIE